MPSVCSKIGIFATRGMVPQIKSVFNEWVGEDSTQTDIGKK